LTIAAEILDSPETRGLFQEATELTAIVTASRATVKRGHPPVVAIVAGISLMAILALMAFMAIPRL
jgi:hypothetical protein